MCSRFEDDEGEEAVERLAISCLYQMWKGLTSASRFASSAERQTLQYCTSRSFKIQKTFIFSNKSATFV